ncbi:hypothetical protein DCC85_06120 [Paenibacillus sp. CAA11]|uniref:hypothetical protein n=1 Tax=Paenibacillus sp. CAA11 TaxID=1532905 RepID=UPI000D35F04B|nr:hypothetical protein [Paenibacillus sp. CAA11]AWB43837.1 hypothetical protein DCC85_06120 [Paenibacillus sp. CAA11]
MFDHKRSEQGVVSVFLILVFAFIFAFVAVFIDYTRMAALQAQSEVNAHRAVSSVASAYDPELLDRYGLFAYGQTDEAYIMSKVLQDGFHFSSRENSFNLLGINLESSELDMLQPLGSYPVFEQQLREQMKYKAPINFTLEIFNHLRPLSQVMKEASTTMDVMGKLQKLFDQREQVLDKALEIQRRAAEKAGRMSELVPGRRISYISDQTIGGTISTAEQSAAAYEDYRTKHQADKELPPLERQYSMEIIAYQRDVSKLYSQLQSGLQAANQEHLSLSEAEEFINKAKAYNAEMEVVIRESEQRPALASYDSVSSSKTAALSEHVPGSEEIEKIRQQSRGLLRDEAFFEQALAVIQEQRMHFNQVKPAVQALSNYSGPLLSGSAEPFELKSRVIETAGQLAGYAQKFIDKGTGNAIDQTAARVDAHRTHETERKALEAKAKGGLKEAGNMLGRISSLKSRLQAQQRSFDLLKQYGEENERFNEEAAAHETAGRKLNSTDIYDEGTNSMKNMDDLYGGLADLLTGMTDRCFRSEYVAEYFQAFDVTKLKELIGGNDQDFSGALDQFGSDQQEMEYILYGFHNPVGNVAAAYSEIFATRLAIRTMEGFIVNANKGHPLIILAAALLYGIEHAVQDLVTLTRTGSIPVSKYIKFELSYKDHLRIFMLLHGGGNDQLTRMLALIRLNTSINPTERATYVSSKVTTSIRLFFLPGVARMLNAAGIINGRVKGSRYYAVKQADYSY